jgi:DNA-binding NtrC family response regulator
MVGESGKSPKILVVENNDGVLELVASLIATQGWQPVLAASLGEARSRLRDSHVDAIVTDLSLDDGDGLELVKEVKAGTSESVPMLVISSYATAEMREIVRQAGAIDLIEKPFRLGRFAVILSEALGTGETALTPHTA